MLGVVLAGAAALSGCPSGELDRVRLDLTDVRASADVSDLAAVLTEMVDAAGRLRPDRFVLIRDRLDAQLRTFAVTSPGVTPKLFPTAESRRAYWYNARVAWSIKLAAMAGMTPDIHPKAMDRAFTLGLTEFTLDDIDEILVAEARRSGDFRLAACAPGARVNFAPLPTKPFTAEDLSQRLDGSLSALVVDEKCLVIDVARMQLRVPPMLWAVRDMVMDEFVQATGSREGVLTTALYGRVNRRARRRLQEATGYFIAAQRPRAQLAVPGRRMFFPGKVGRVELPVE